MSTRAAHHKTPRGEQPRQPPRKAEGAAVHDHGVGVRPARLLGAGKTKTRPFLDGDVLCAEYRRPPCLDEVSSYRYWLCNRERCRADKCHPWCDRERRARGLQ